MSEREVAADYIDRLVRALQALPVETVGRIAVLLEEARAEGRTVFLLGNGGSSAIASHLACDLNKTAIRADRPRLRAIALTDNMPVITAWANDADYAAVFAEQLENFVRPGDVVIAISGSGRSPNVLEALRRARAHGAVTVGLTGFDGGEFSALTDVCLIVPSEDYGQIEDAHSAIAHALTAALRGGPAAARPRRATPRTSPTA